MAIYPSALEPDSIFAKDFRVVRGLRVGGMGAVYVVTQISTGKQRALKLLASQLVNNTDMRERFVREAQAAAEIESDHVVEIVTAGVDDETGTPYIVMELLKGEELADAVDRRGAFPLAEVRVILEQLGDALRQAHAQRIVHRDLKPENIFLATPRRRGLPFTAKLLDFGVAKFLALGASEMGTAPVGSPLFMAPEQTDSYGNICPATDVWALGLLAFYLLTGRSYWLGAERASVPVLLREVCLDPLVSASDRAHQLGVAELVPEGFDAWFGRCVVREIESRFAEGGEAIDAFLEAVAEGAGPELSEHPPPLLDDYDPYAIPPSGPHSPPSALDRTSAAPPPSSERLELDDDPEPPTDEPAEEVVETAASIEDVPLPPPLLPPGLDRPTPPGLATEIPKPAEPSPPAPPWTRRKKLMVVAIGIGFGAALGGGMGLWTRAPKKAPPASEDAAPSEEPFASSIPSALSTRQAPVFSPCPRTMTFVPAGESAPDATEAYCFDRTEVTVKAWSRCVSAGVCEEPNDEIDYPKGTAQLTAVYRELCNAGPPRALYPQNCVDWWSAATYCRWAGGRLPREQEWSRIAKADAPPTAGKSPKPTANRCGEECLDWGLAHGVFIRVDNHDSDGFEGSSPVATYPRAAGAPVDLDGNVAEWTIGRDSTADARSVHDADAARIVMGLAFMQLPRADLASGKIALDPSTKSPLIGFRCVMTPQAPPTDERPGPE